MKVERIHLRYSQRRNYAIEVGRWRLRLWLGWFGRRRFGIRCEAPGVYSGACALVSFTAFRRAGERRAE